MKIKLNECDAETLRGLKDELEIFKKDALRAVDVAGGENVVDDLFKNHVARIDGQIELLSFLTRR